MVLLSGEAGIGGADDILYYQLTVTFPPPERGFTTNTAPPAGRWSWAFAIAITSTSRRTRPVDGQRVLSAGQEAAALARSAA